MRVRGNAIRVGVYPRRLRKPEIVHLFMTGLRALQETRRLRLMVTDGMYFDTWHRMCEAVLAEARIRPGEHLILEDLLRDVTETTVAIRAVRHAIGRGRPTLITLNRRYNHWTVGTGFSRARLNLFDSSGHRWVNWASVELEDTGETRPHSLDRALALRRIVT